MLHTAFHCHVLGQDAFLEAGRDNSRVVGMGKAPDPVVAPVPEVVRAHHRALEEDPAHWKTVDRLDQLVEHGCWRHWVHREPRQEQMRPGKRLGGIDIAD